MEDHDQHVRRLAFEALKWASADGKDAALSASILLLDKVLMIGDLYGGGGGREEFVNLESPSRVRIVRYKCEYLHSDESCCVHDEHTGPGGA